MVYNISYKTLIGAKPLHIRFDKIHGFMRVIQYYLKLENIVPFSTGLHFLYEEKVVLHMLFLIIKKSKLIPLILSLWKNVDISCLRHVKSILNKDQNQYCFNIFLETGSYQLSKNNDS